jgi:hypothetical protein
VQVPATANLDIRVSYHHTPNNSSSRLAFGGDCECIKHPAVGLSMLDGNATMSDADAAGLWSRPRSRIPCTTRELSDRQRESVLDTPTSTICVLRPARILRCLKIELCGEDLYHHSCLGITYMWASVALNSSGRASLVRSKTTRFDLAFLPGDCRNGTI